MKRYIFLLLLFVTLVPTSLLKAQTVKVYYRDGTLLKIPVEEVQSIKPYIQENLLTNGHEFVDLGLSVMWATCNIGAEKPEQAGEYFAWGETEPKTVFGKDNYKFGIPPSKYNEEYDTNLEMEDDAARAIWKGNWRLPTKTEEEELYRCQWEWTENDEVKGFMVIGPSGKSIFLPVTGLYDGNPSQLIRTDIGGWYWVGTTNGINYARGICFPSENYLYRNVPNHDRYDGHVIRPVIADYKDKDSIGILITKTNGVEIDIPEEELDSIVGFAGYPFGIPEDDDADPNPDIEDPNTVIPNPHGTLEWEGVDLIFRLDMTGIQDPNDPKTWLQLYGTGSPDQNIWVSIDNQPKGFVISNIDDETVPADIVFLVDNSGSMSQEADVIARDILSWAQYLVGKNLNVKFGCVGYSEYGEINGAFDLNEANALSAYLNKYSGTNRTKWFSGDNATSLQFAAKTYKVKGECGGMALQYADANLTFRDNANRIYVNFTDEPNQPNNVAAYSVEWFNPEKGNWPASKGTVHTVYSDGYNAIIVENPNYSEDPAKLSSYTGGTIIKTNSTLSGVTLNDLPITNALTNSYIIRMTNVMGVADGEPHEVKITILSKDGMIRGERIFSIVIAPRENEE